MRAEWSAAGDPAGIRLPAPLPRFAGAGERRIEESLRERYFVPMQTISGVDDIAGLALSGFSGWAQLGHVSVKHQQGSPAILAAVARLETVPFELGSAFQRA